MKTDFFTFLFSFLFLLLMLACTSDTPADNPDDLKINYLALGDSYTIGEGVSVSERWPNQLSQRLEENIQESINTEIIAQTGWTTGNLLNEVPQAQLEKYDMVSLLIGVNNQFVGQAFNIFQNEFDSLVNISIDLAGNKENVFVMSIPDYGVTPFGSSNSATISEEIDMYNSYIKQKCIAIGISFIDITEISRTLGDDPGALASDNLHPGASQYTEWMEAALPFAEGILNN